MGFISLLIKQILKKNVEKPNDNQRHQELVFLFMDSPNTIKRLKFFKQSVARKKLPTLILVTVRAINIMQFSSVALHFIEVTHPALPIFM